jgi:hypothetical protein
MEGQGPASLQEIPCDCWVVKEGPEPGTHALLCIACGWYRIIPEQDVKAAEALSGAVEMLFGEEEDA